MKSNTQIRRVLAGVAGLALVLAARAQENNADMVQFDDLPAVIQQALTQHAGNATIGQIGKTPDMFDVDFTLDGVKQNILISEDATKPEGPRPIKTDAEAAADPAEETTAGQPNAEAKNHACNTNTGVLVQWSGVSEADKNLFDAKFPGASVDQVHRRDGFFFATLNNNGETTVIRIAENGTVLSGPGANEAAA